MTKPMQEAPPIKSKPRTQGVSVKLRVGEELYDAMRKRARAEGVNFSLWLRTCAVKELRRRRKPF